MKFLKLKALIVSAILCAATSAFADYSYEVKIDTSLLSGDAYLYLQYDRADTSVTSTATVSMFTVNGGSLGAQQFGSANGVVNGSAVSGTLPASVVFTNTNEINDYNQLVHLGSYIDFVLTTHTNSTSSTSVGSNDFSLGLFADAAGSTPLLNLADANIPGTAAIINQFDTGATNATSLDSTTSATPTPIPAAAWLLGSGLMGLVGVRRRKQN